MLSLCVDNILIFSSDMQMINDTKKFSKNNFNIKDLDPVDVFLAIKIIREGWTM